MTQKFKAKLVNDYRHGRPTDTKRYRYVLRELFKSCDGQWLYGVDVYGQYDRDDIEERELEHNLVCCMQFWY